MQMSRQELAQIKRMRQAFFRAKQYVNGEFAKRYAVSTPEALKWYDEEMSAIVGPAYAALKELLDD